MTKNIINILLVEDDQIDAQIVKRALADNKDGNIAFDIIRYDTLTKAIDYLSSDNNTDIILLDLNLPDSNRRIL